MMHKRLRIVFFGTPEFAVASLDKLVGARQQIVGVVTAPDKPAGRGNQQKSSAIKEYALSYDLELLQPVNLKAPDFVNSLQALNADLQVVVAFRMLPEVVWDMPPSGTFNLHASLLPEYRGAAPINWAIINGETETGVTTFFIQHEIDTGKIIMSEKTPISPDETAGSLHDRLKEMGADLVLDTVNSIAKDECQQTDQETLVSSGTVLKNAPKIHKEDCRIDWNQTTEQVYNQIRGLSPYPAAWTSVKTGSTEDMSLKIFRCSKSNADSSTQPGDVASDGKTYLRVATSDGCIELTEVQQAGKQRMAIADFIRGFSTIESWQAT